MVAICLTLAMTEHAPGSSVTWSFPEARPTLKEMIDGEAGEPRMTVSFPSDYDPKKKHPLLVMIHGAQGEWGDSAAFARQTAGDSRFICVGVPSFKADIEPLKEDKSNYWSRMFIGPSDGATCWARYKPMFAKLFKEVPSIDRKKTFFGGFSNGANTASAILSSPAAEDFLKVFRGFVFIEGGLSASPAKRLKGAEFFLARGEKNEGDYHKKLKEVLTERGARISEHIMPGLGHAYDEAALARVREWISSVSGAGRP